MRIPAQRVALALALLVADAATGQIVEPSLEAETDAYLEPYLATGNFSGSVLIARDGVPVLAKGYGYASLEHGVANTPETVYHLASVSRVFTSTAALQLVAGGRLALDDTVAKHVPDFPRGDKITLRHLLTLSAGFPNMNSMPEYGLWSMAPQTPASLVEKFRDLELRFEPGERTEHSNSNYNLLALIIERVSGLPFGDYLERNLFAPLGMAQSGHHGDASRIIPHLATGYTPSGVAGFVKAPWLDWSVKTGNGSLYSTVHDLLRFDRALAEGKLLPAPLIDEAFTEHFENKGFGWFIRPRFGDRELYINGRSPGFGSYLGRLERQGLTVIVLGNLYNSQPTTIARDLMAIALGQPFEAPSFSAEPLDPALLAELVGEFQFGADFYSPNLSYALTAQDGHLMANGDWLMPAGPLRFIHRIYGSEIVFERDDDGAIRTMLFDEFRGHRIGAPSGR